MNRIFCAYLLFCVGASQVFADTKPYLRQYVPVATVIEDVPHSSKLYMGIDQRDVNQLFEEYVANASKESIEDALGVVIDSIQKNDADAFMKSASGIPNAKAAKDMLEGFRTVGIVSDVNIKITKEIAIGDDVLVFVNVDSPTHPPLVFFQFVRKGEKIVCSFERFSDPIVQLITTTIRAAEARPDDYRPVASDALSKLNRVIVTKFYGQEIKEHPVEFMFAATKLKQRLAPQLVAEDELKRAALSNDQRQIVIATIAWLRAAAAKDVEAMKAMVAGEVSQRQLAGISKNQAGLKSMSESAISSRFASCVIDLGETKVLVYQVNKGPYKVPPLLHTTFWLSPNAELKVANYAQINAFEKFLSSDSFALPFAADFINKN